MVNQNGDIVETTYNYTEARRARSFLGISLIEVFEGAEDTGPGVYHPGDVVNYATKSRIIYYRSNGTHVVRRRTSSGN